MYKVGIRSIFSELLRQERLVVSNDIMPATPKTKEFLTKIKQVDGNRILIIADDINENLILAARNITLCGSCNSRKCQILFLLVVC
jgi:large subunit ribosomal protein L4